MNKDKFIESITKKVLENETFGLFNRSNFYQHKLLFKQGLKKYNLTEKGLFEMLQKIPVGEINMNNKKWKFKRTIFGKQALMFRYDVPVSLNFASHWRYADQDDIVEFTSEIKKLRESIKVVKRLRETHPEFFI